MKLLLLPTLILLFLIPCLGQKDLQNVLPSSQAQKFDESTYSLYKYDNFYEKLSSFAEVLRKHPTSKAYIIVYDTRLTYECNHSANTLLIWAKGYLEHTQRIAQNRIIGIEGGFREKLTVELYIVPKGATLPSLTPTIEPNKAVRCPCQGHVYKSGINFENTNSPLGFYYSVIGQSNSKLKPFYNWTVSDGRIISGQGTSSITVERPATGYKSIRATVELQGISSECDLKPASESSPEKLGSLPAQIDEFGRISCDDELSRVDLLAMGLQAEPSTDGYIITYGGRSGKRNEAKAVLARLRAYLVQARGINPERVKIIDGGFKETLTTELWIFERGKGSPALTPTVDRKDVKLKGRAIIRDSCGIG